MEKTPKEQAYEIVKDTLSLKQNPNWDEIKSKLKRLIFPNEDPLDFVYLSYDCMLYAKNIGDLWVANTMFDKIFYEEIEKEDPDMIPCFALELEGIGDIFVIEMRRTWRQSRALRSKEITFKVGLLFQ